MAFSFVTCLYCNKNFLKDNKHINENLKLGNNFYCSPQCQYSFKDKKTELTCDNLKCDSKFRRKPKDISPHNFCSRSCAVSVNNSLYPKKVATIRKCAFCGNRMFKYRTYCSVRCSAEAHSINKEEVIDRIIKFYNNNGRVPVKREMYGIYKAARKYFGTWNNAIEVAGFQPNPVLFANHQVANDGHICDSLAEKLIDDYLFEKSISHERSVSYPGGIYTADFKIGDKLIEYFGLAGEHKRYDELRIIKQRITKKLKLKLIEIYPKDLYPHNKLDSIL